MRAPRSPIRRLLAIVLLAASAAAIGAPGAAAQTFPTRPVTLIGPFAAGGPVDTIARIVGDRMRQSLGKPVLVEAVTGAAGTIGVGRVARATPDGYTLSIGNTSTHVFNGAIYTLPFDLLDDLVPVGLLASNPMMIVSRAGVPASSLTELLDWIRQHPDKVSAGTAGVGSSTHIAGVYLEQLTGLKLLFVPYRGTGPAMNDLVAGQLDLIVDQASNSVPQVRARAIRAYGVTAPARLAAAPEVPTTDEAGLKGFQMSIWTALWAPRGTPEPVIATLAAAVAETLADPELRQRFADLGLEIPPRERQTPAALAALQRAEADKWWPIIRRAGIKGE